jgi:hypothetical protein
MTKHDTKNPFPAHWPYNAHRPQRYVGQYQRYLAGGGSVRLEEDVQGFTAGGKNVDDMARFYAFCLIQDQLAKEGLPGDIAELGVYKGHTATLLAAAARRLDKTLYLFDTFEGFDQRDLMGLDSKRALQFSDTSLEAVRSLVGEERVNYVQGYFPGTATAIPDNTQFCLVHIDCDLYAPALSALEYFYPRLCPGGFMVVHDYTSMQWPGLEQALDEFLASRSESLVPMPDGAGTAIFRKAKRAHKPDNWYLRRRAEAIRKDWTPAQSGALAQLLREGWATPEPWGMWGIGDRHELSLFFIETPARDLKLELECQAVIYGSRTEQQVDVFVESDLVATWQFSQKLNRAVRSAPIRVPAIRASLPELRLRFEPRSVASPNELDPASLDTRKLGLGIVQLRLVDAEGANTA